MRRVPSFTEGQPSSGGVDYENEDEDEDDLTQAQYPRGNDRSRARRSE